MNKKKYIFLKIYSFYINRNDKQKTELKKKIKNTHNKKNNNCHTCDR